MSGSVAGTESSLAADVNAGAMRSGSIDAEKAAANHEKKIKRIQLSCTSCRHRKLKCNRLQPCENCVKRGQATSCYYANPGPKKTPAQARLSARNNELQQRLVHLEQLVVSLQGRNEGSPDSIVAAMQARDRTSPASAQTSSMDGENEGPGRMVTDKAGTRYVDSAHWQAMLDEITRAKAYVDVEDGEEDDANIAELAKGPGAPILLGSVAPGTKSDLLGGIPSRPIVDRLVKRWFDGKAPALIVTHLPTFMDEYDEFWRDPRSATPAYLALLYSMIWLGTAFYLRMDEPPPTDRPADTASLMDGYLTKAVQALVLADYTRPGKHKLEALLLYFSAEYLRYRDASTGISFLMSVIVRAAMVAGYHRDPKHFPSLDTFEGEMRRRTWILLQQLDTLVAFQVGMPRVIQDWQTDTEPPRNLQDEDLYVGMEKLPPSRPESERTPVTYQITKGRLMAVFGKVSDRAYSREKMTYDEIMVLDMRLREAYESLPTSLRVKPLNLSLTDPPEVIMQRYNLSFVYHKTRCILHRRCFSGALTDARCQYSRRICVESALETLKKQKEVHDATTLHAYGMLNKDSWYLSSLTTHDFIMAAMVLCLWLSREQENSKSPEIDALEALRAQPDKAELFQALEDSYKIWLAIKDKSYEAYKASQALAVMLGKTRARADKPTNPISDHLTKQFNTRMGMQETSPVANGNVSVNSASTASDSAHSGSPQQETTPSSEVNAEAVEYEMPDFDSSAFGAVSENLLDAPLDLDWDTWDMQYRFGKEMNKLDVANIDWANDPIVQDLNNYAAQGGFSNGNTFF